MSFASATPVPRYPHTPIEETKVVIEGDGLWPEIDTNIARIVMRLNGTVTLERLVESLENSAQAIQKELLSWSENKESLSSKEKGLYLRAVYFDAKADLTERYRDFDTTGAGDRRADDLSESIDDARRNVRWAVADLMGKPRLTVEAL